MEGLDIARRKQIMEVLSGFLQSTKRTVEQLCEGHSVASMQASKQRRAPAFGIPSSVDKGLSHDALGYHFPCKPDLSQRWPFPAPSSTLNERFSERTSDYTIHETASWLWRFSESETDRMIASFLNDMRKTVDTWCARYRLLAGGKDSIEVMPQPMQSDMQAMRRLDFEPETDRNYSVSASLDDRDNEVLLPYSQNRQIIAQPSVKTISSVTKRVRRKPPTVRINRKRSRASGRSSQGIPEGLNTGTVALSQQDMVAGPEPILSEAQLEGSTIDSNGHLKSMSLDNHVTSTTEGATGKLNYLEQREKAAVDIESPVQTDELTIRPHHYKIEVVENPDWLPKGWITELKTRSTGGSAGCKDKYYYDPVSKRRCRSQKEVFCFLETGKLGRYKRKQQPASKLLGLDLEQQVSNASEMQVTEKEEVPGMRSASQPYSQEGAPGILGVFPGGGQRGWGSGTFLPYRPGQTADVLYDSLSPLSRPGLDQYRYIDPIKSSGDKSFNPSRPWFLANTEVSSGALIDRIEIDNITEQDVGQGFGRGRKNGEAAAKRTRKSTKRAVS